MSNDQKKFEYKYTAPDGSSFACEIINSEEGKPATVTIQIYDPDERRKEQVLKECEDIGRLLEMNARKKDAIREVMKRQENG
jgi:predicted RNA-binding protein YlqC (UPF0109 family)